MIRGNDLESQVYDQDHIHEVLGVMRAAFPRYFETFSSERLAPRFESHIESHTRERDKYRDYLSLEVLEEYEYDPEAFKGDTKKGACPIIHRCLMSPDDIMKDYRRSFYATSGSTLLETVQNIAMFGLDYVAHFGDAAHEACSSYEDLGLAALNEASFGCEGVIGYGVQSTILHGCYAREFAHRSQNAVWSLYFLSERQSFGLVDGSEFLMAKPDEGICEQNYFYPAELFGYYALQVYLWLKRACHEKGFTFHNIHRYVYLDAFFDNVAEAHRRDIDCYKQNSEKLESQPWRHLHD